MQVKDIMTKSFQACSVDTPIIDAIKIFSKYKLDIIPIVNEENKLIGITTKNKIIYAISDGHSLEDSIKLLINYNPIYVFPEADILETRKKLLHFQIRHAPVIDTEKQLIGIISTSQILFAYTKTLDLLQSQLQILFNSLDFGLISVDTNMRITAINPLARKILQFENQIETTDSFINQNKPLKDMIQYILVNREKPPKKKLSLNGYSFIVDCIPIFENKKLNGVIIVIDDLTKLEELIRELEITKQWEEKLRTVVGSAYDAIVLVDENGIITMANKGFCELFKTTEITIIGKSILNHFPNLGIREVLDLKIPLSGIPKMIHSKQCLVTNLPINNNGELVGVVSKITFRGLKQLQDALNKASKFEETTSFLYEDQKVKNGTKYSIADIIGTSSKIKKVKKEAFAASQSRSTVLLIGESGTGKELFAHGIHTASSLPGSFVKVNCAAIPADLLESEFFGYADGAFTGAKKGGKKGKFELAQNGTLFLDEIGDMPLNLQSKLLRVLQEKEFEPVGSNKTIKLDIRIIAATNKRLEEMVKNGDFREDLYYRLNIFRLNIPPLKERKEDIPDITAFIVERLNQTGFYIKGITPPALKVLTKYNWPGNIRELQNVLERAANLNENGYIDIPVLPDYILEHQDRHPAEPANHVDIETASAVEKSDTILPIDYKKNLNETEKELILKALRMANGNKTTASKILGISRTWLYSKMKKYQIEF